MAPKILGLLLAATLVVGASRPLKNDIPNIMFAVYATQYAPSYSAVNTSNNYPTPAVKENHVLVRVQGSSINPIDWKVLDGSVSALFPLSFPQVLGCDVVGVVAAVGAGADARFSIGKLVWAVTGSGNTEGAYADYLAIHEDNVGILPSGLAMSASDLATIPFVGKTMFQALEYAVKAEIFNPERNRLNRSIVVVTSGPGGTGVMGVQLARALGASHVITTGKGESQAELLVNLGANRVIDYTKADILRSLDAESVDVIIDNYGYDVDECMSKIRSGGIFVSLTHAAPSVPVPGVMNISLTCDPKRHDDLEVLGLLVAQGKLRPIVAKTFAVIDVVNGFKADVIGGLFGKLAVKVNLI